MCGLDVQDDSKTPLRAICDCPALDNEMEMAYPSVLDS